MGWIQNIYQGGIWSAQIILSQTRYKIFSCMYLLNIVKVRMEEITNDYVHYYRINGKFEL